MHGQGGTMSEQAITSGTASGFPALTAGHERARPPADPYVFISIIVPIRNEARFITRTLEQIAAQNYPPDRYEVLVVDGESDDGTPELVRSFAQAHPTLALSLLANPKRLSSAARNIGVRAALGDYLLIIDGHVEIPSRNLLLSALEKIEQHGPLVLGRPQRLSPGGLSRTQQLIAATRACPIGHALDSHIYGDFEGWTDPSSIGVMYHRGVFDKVGLFDESFDAAEDLEFNTRLAVAGVSCYTSPALEILYFPRENHAGLLRQMQRYGLGRANLWRKQGRMPSIAALAPAVLTAGAILGPVAALCGLLLRNPWFTDAWAVGALAYLLLGLIVYRRDPQLQTFGYVDFMETILTVHIGMGLGIWKGLLRRRPDTVPAYNRR